MNYLSTDKDSVMLGSGYLYAMAAGSFNASSINTASMTEIGYIKDSAKFTRTHDQKEIDSANYGTVTILNGKYTTTFETGIISYNAANVANFLTGDNVVVADPTTSGTTTITTTNKTTTYYGEDSKTPDVALVFVGEDADTGKSFMLVMPKCKWVGDYELDFNNDNPVELNYKFRCLNTTMPNGKVGAGWLVETSVTTSAAQ